MVKNLKQRIAFSSDVKIFLKNELLVFKGLNNRFFLFPARFCSNIDSNVLNFDVFKSFQNLNKLLGTFYALTKQNFRLISQEYVKNLILKGVGYRAEVSKNELILKLGFSQTTCLLIPGGLTVTCPTRTTVRIGGSDVNLVENFVFQIKKLRKPEPYKGKGILTRNQQVRLKTVKK